MEIRIGVIHTAKELTVEVDGSADDFVSELETALQDGTKLVWLTNTKGRRVGAVVDKIAYVEIDEDVDQRRVGFGR